ncbi:metallophosphoesterase family protein [Thermus thermamylovorans]|uniref:Metallophosphoesterase n=1 Tax=Thermus thermamylovorans TaxID=2509362 RepID=A0A4Q9B8I1_9DEIN|nr:metallophosphoesterase family protein [Thermus thermamylovorans]TBH21188.1 metallophosphoesterase [Thermus thermamylovorans]
MRHLVLADIHGNWPALEAVLQAAPPFDRVLFLGDAVGYYPDGDRVLDWLLEVGAECVLGNHDAWLLALEALPQEGAVLEILAWQRARLSRRHLEFLASWPWQKEAAGALLVHGSPCDPFEYLDELEAARRAFACTEARLAFHGHTHLAGAFLQLPGPRPWVRYGRFLEGGELRLPPAVRALANPGSVGQPRDGVPGAAFALWEGERLEFFRVAYDLGRVARRLEEEGFPLWLYTRLTLGE